MKTAGSKDISQVRDRFKNKSGLTVNFKLLSSHSLQSVMFRGEGSLTSSKEYIIIKSSSQANHDSDFWQRTLI